jgi:protein O-mannosyl-transferase
LPGWLPAVVLVIATLLVYLPAHRHPFFTMDDDQYVVNNARLKAPIGDLVSWAFTTYDLANWHPVTWLSHAADVRFFQLDPAGHHDVNVLLHALNALLLFWVLYRATGYAGRSFMVAALFALHPVNVETVAWIAERKNVLSMTFFLLALGAYGWYAAKPRIGRYAAVAILFALGLMAKPQIITFPFVALLWDYWPLERIAIRHSPFAFRENSKRISGEKRISNGEWRFSRLLLEKVPFLALSLASAILTMRAQSYAGAMRYYPLPQRLGNATVCYVRYIRNAFWPSRLAVFYTHPSLGAVSVSLSLLLLLVITSLVLYKHDERYLAAGWFWFLGTLVPMIGLVQVGEQAMADRYAYLSFIGLFIMVCWGVAEVAETRHAATSWLAGVSVAVLLVLALLTHRQLSYWSDNVTLWSHMLEVSGGSYEVEENLGVALLEDGQARPAMEHFERVTALVPPPPAPIGRELAGYAAVAHLYIGAYDQRQQRPAEAVVHFQQVLALAKEFAAQNKYANVPPLLIRIEAISLADMGDAYYVLGDFGKAKTSYEGALALGPLTAHQWMGLGIANQRSGNLAGAVEAYQRATRLQVSDVGFLLLAQALEKSGHTQEAKAARQQAQLISPDMAAAERTVDNVLGH